MVTVVDLDVVWPTHVGWEGMGVAGVGSCVGRNGALVRRKLASVSDSSLISCDSVLAGDTTFEVVAPLVGVGGPERGRVGVLKTPHGTVDTPAFVPVGTAASVKTLTPAQVRSSGAQAVLANAYHLYLRPGAEIVDTAGGVAEFMRWNGPTFTDSGGFQVMSLGGGYKKVIAMTPEAASASGEVKGKLATVDDDGVTFRSHIDGSRHRFTPEVSIGIQHQLGADVMFAFDELTTLSYGRSAQDRAVARTKAWAWRCLVEHAKQTAERTHRPKQSLWGVIQGAHYEDLRRNATRGLVEQSRAACDEHGRGFGGWGIGGALDKNILGTIVGWCVDELPVSQPRHLLGISEPDDVFAAVENGADTFDCVAPTRMARHGTLLTFGGRVRLQQSRYRTDHSPLDPESALPEAQDFTRAYVHHLLRAKEQLGLALVSMANLTFMHTLMATIRSSILDGSYREAKEDILGRYYRAQALP